MSGSLCGGLAAGEGGTFPGEGEHDEGDDRVRAVEAEAAADDQSGLGVRRLDQAVAHARQQSRADRLAVTADAALEVDEGGDATAAGPADPPVQGLQRRGGAGLGQGEYGPRGFLVEVGAVEAG